MDCELRFQVSMLNRAQAGDYQAHSIIRCSHALSPEPDGWIDGLIQNKVAVDVGMMKDEDRIVATVQAMLRRV